MTHPPRTVTGMTSTPTEVQPSDEDIAAAAATWLRSQYPDLTAADCAELHDRRLARVVRNHQAGEVASAAVVAAVREWRSRLGDTTWLDGWDGELVRLIDRSAAATEPGA